MPAYSHCPSRLLCCVAFLVVSVLCRAQSTRGTDTAGNTLTAANVLDADPYVISPETDQRMEYALRLTLPKAEVTGVLVVKQTDDGELRCAIMNEFGVSALHFSVTADRRKVTLVNVSALFDKWYVRRVVRNDLRILFQARHSMLGRERKRRLVLMPDSRTLLLLNQRTKMSYEMRKI